MTHWVGLLLIIFVSVAPVRGQFDGYINHGLVGVGRVPAGTFDKAGDGRQDTLGGFSAMATDPASVRNENGKITATLIGLPDRGFGDGTTDYHPRLEVFEFSIAPYFGPGPAPQNQITFTNVATRLLKDEAGNVFTGFDAGETNGVTRPRSLANSVGHGRFSLDPEGIAFSADSSYWISDEYGPAIYLFGEDDHLIKTILPPPALLPRSGAYPGFLNFSATNAPASGRRNNRGLEGLSLTPDGKRLVAVLQSPTMQDGGGGNLGRNTRILEFNADKSSTTYGSLVRETVYQLTLNGSAATNRHTPASEILALNANTFLVLEHDSNGLGTGTNVPPTHKRIVLAATAGATDIAGTAYDLESGAPGQISLPTNALPANVKPVMRMDFVDLLDGSQLAKFGLNTKSVHDTNTISEKWEALALLPMSDPAHPNEYLLLVGNDNDFKAPITYHNGSPVGTNVVTVDLMLLAFRVALPRTSAKR